MLNDPNISIDELSEFIGYRLAGEILRDNPVAKKGNTNEHQLSVSEQVHQSGGPGREKGQRDDESR